MFERVSERSGCVRRACVDVAARQSRAEQRSLSFFVVLCACVASVSLSVCLPCLVCFTFILATGRGCSNVPMFDCSTVSTAFAYSNDDTCVRSRYSLRRRLLIGLCCYSSSLFVLLLVLLLLFLLLFLLLSFYSSCPLVPSAPCRTLLFNIFVPLVLNFSTFCASLSLFPSLSLSHNCCCCWYYVRAKLLVKCLSGAESLTQFSLVHCTSHDSQTC